MGQIGESLVVAELGRRGIVATAFAGNVPDIDLLTYKNGKTQALQVKAWRTGSVHFDATRFLHIAINGNLQNVNAIDEELDPDLIYVFVLVGERSGEDRFFILTQRKLQSQIFEMYRFYLAKHGGQRPRNAQTTHHAVTLSDLMPSEDNWSLIERRFD